MTVPHDWEALRVLFARAALRKGYDVPERYGGTAEELYCFPAIGKTIKEMGEEDFIDILETIWQDDLPGQHRVVGLAKAYFVRRKAGTVLTRKQAKAEWRAAAGGIQNRENPEAAVVWGLAALLQEGT